MPGYFRVDLEFVERALRRHPAIVDAFLHVRTTAEPACIVAFVQVDEDGTAAGELEEHCRRTLPGYMVPQEFVRLERLPRDASGRIDVDALSSGGAPARAVPPLTRLEAEMQQIWEEVLAVPSVGLTDNFFDLGGHSLLATLLFARIERKLGFRLPLLVLFQHPTIAGLLGTIHAPMPGPLGVSLVCLKPTGDRAPLFLLHTLGGGGGAGLLAYHALAQHLGADQPVFGFIAPEDPLTTIESMAAHYVRELRALDPVGPYHLGGFCFGGVLAYEMACQLDGAGAKVALLALIDSTPPNPPGRPRHWGAEYVKHLIRTVPRWLLHSIRDPGDLLARLRKLARLAYTGNPLTLAERVVNFDGHPVEFKRHAEAHWTAFLEYHPGPYAGPLTLIHTDRPTLLSTGPARAWRNLAATVHAHVVAAKHDDILEDPHAATVARILRVAMDRAAGDRQASAVLAR